VNGVYRITGVRELTRTERQRAVIVGYAVTARRRGDGRSISWVQDEPAVLGVEVSVTFRPVKR
jgi:hypothetical protein